MQAPSLAFALESRTKIVRTTFKGETSPISQVATPSRGELSPALTPTTAGITPVASPAHYVRSSGDSFGSQVFKVSVIAPGGGTGINGAVYAKLGKDPQLAVDIVGRSRAPYDVYPQYWPNGSAAPNLETFAEDVLRQRWVEKSDCFVFGSRGGQVVLPFLWKSKGAAMPPAVCLNGGCAMDLPRKVQWPISAVTFLLIGGEDYFKGNATADEYMATIRGNVPAANSTTAILYVSEMGHMPQQALLDAVLPLMLRAVLSWKTTRRPPREVMRLILAAVNRDGWSGRLMFTQGPSDWAPEVDFGPFTVSRRDVAEVQKDAQRRRSASLGASGKDSKPIQVSRKDELKALFRAAASASKPGGGAPLAQSGARFHAAVKAAKASKPQLPEEPAAANTVASTVASPTKRKQLSLPIPASATCRASSPGNFGLGAASKYEAFTPRSPNRLAVPRCTSPCAPTPISRALGMEIRCPSPARTLQSPLSRFEVALPVRVPVAMTARG